MRLIDAEKLEKELRIAIAMMQGMALVLGKDEFTEGEIKAYKDILHGLKDEPKVEQEVQDVAKGLTKGDIFVICPFCKQKVFIEGVVGDAVTGRCEHCGIELVITMRRLTKAEQDEMLKEQRRIFGENVESRPTTLHKGFE